MANVSLPPDSDRLTKKEITFLAHCCTYNHTGHSLDRFSVLAKYIISTNMCKNAKEVSFYKTRLGAKKWIKAARDTFELPKSLLDPKEPKSFKIAYIGK